jgi:hypothetical protein
MVCQPTERKGSSAASSGCAVSARSRVASDIYNRTVLAGADAVYAPPSTLSDAVRTVLSAPPYRTQSWSMSMATAAGLYW